MSSILDALKKSEAERQRGTPPTLDSPIVFQRRSAPARRRPVWLLPALATAALAGAWYGGLLPWPAPSTTSEPATTAGPANAPATTAAGGSEPVADSPDKDPAAAAQSGPAPVEPTAAPAPTPETAATASVPSRGIFGGAARTDAARPTSTDAQGVDPAPGAEPVEPAMPQVGLAVPPVSAPVVGADDPGTTAPAASGAGPQSIHELPFAVRRELPELKVTMHMYSADPQRRFILLNGVRARDGESLEGGLEVVEIRAADVVLRYQGTEFLLPLRG